MYTQKQRIAHARNCLTLAANGGYLDRTSCWAIAHTYGIPEYIDELKKLRAVLWETKNELATTSASQG